MTNLWELPTCLCVGGENLEIETDYRKILKILKVFSDPEYDIDEQWEICIGVLFKDYDVDNPPSGYILAEMQKQAMEFIDAGIKVDEKKRPRVMDWWQDAPILAAPISKALGRDVRSPEPLHWWTFLGAYMGIGESLFSEILNIRIKKYKGQKLEKHEQEFYKENKSLIDLQINRVERSQEEKDELRALFGFSK